LIFFNDSIFDLMPESIHYQQRIMFINHHLL